MLRTATLPVEERTASRETAETTMSTNDETRPTDDDREGYDPAQDPDADPESLNPRTGSQAQGGTEGETGDTDADPDSLNPRPPADGGTASDGSGS